jgi:tripartite ATP-independent transporter DctP family solute receptor
MRTACVLGVVTTILATLPADAREFRSSDIYPSNYPTVQGVVQMDRLMRERSEGRHGITVLADRDNAVTQVRNGTLDMARVNLTALSDALPMTAVPALPYLFKSTAHARRVFDGPIGDEILASLEAQGLIGLCLYDGGPRNFYSGKRAIRTPADIKGMRVRVQQPDIWGAMMRALGAEPVVVPFDQISPAFQSGMIEAAEQNWPSYVSLRHYNVARYFSLTEHSMAPTVVIFSKRVWDTLSADDQSLIRGAARDSVPHMRRLWDDQDTASRQTVEKSGGEIVSDVDKAAFADALRPIYPTIIGDPGLRALVRRIQNDE